MRPEVDATDMTAAEFEERILDGTPEFVGMVAEGPFWTKGAFTNVATTQGNIGGLQYVSSPSTGSVTYTANTLK